MNNLVTRLQALAKEFQDRAEAIANEELAGNAPKYYLNAEIRVHNIPMELMPQGSEQRFSSDMTWFDYDERVSSKYHVNLYSVHKQGRVVFDDVTPKS